MHSVLANDCVDVCRAVYGVTVIKIIKELYAHCKNIEFIVQRER